MLLPAFIYLTSYKTYLQRFNLTYNLEFIYSAAGVYVNV